jgi:hypothetical protein
MSPLPSPPPFVHTVKGITVYRYVPLRDAHHYVAGLAPFRGNSMHAHTVMPSTDIRMGLLNADDRRRLYAANEANPVYVVWSYSTPIAWCVNGTWHAVAQKFSRTTSRHQSIVRRALTPALAFTA